jgi:hypothetical protein
MSALEVTKPEDYGQIETDKGELVQMPSGAVFRLRHANVQDMALIGEVPQSLVSVGLEAWRRQGTVPSAQETSPAQVEPEEALQTVIFARQVVIENCLEPRLGYNEAGVVSLLNDKGESVAKIKPGDLTHAFLWITHQQGVTLPAGLGRFRNRQERRATASKSHSKKLRSTPVSVT